MEPKPGETYLHFKGGKYEVLAVGTHTETEARMVVYKSVFTDKVWVRPLDKWLEPVREGVEKPRFRLLHASEK